MKKHHIIYIPGLGDHWDEPRRFALRFWKIFGVTTQLVPMQWYNKKSYANKQALIESAIQAAVADGKTVSIIGESAGASIALNVFYTDIRLHRLVTVCGVVYPQATISPYIYNRSPAFQSSMQQLPSSINQSLRTQNISVITSVYDPIVSHKHNVLDDVKPIRMPSIGHFTTIAACLTLFSWIVIRQIKK